MEDTILRIEKSIWESISGETRIGVLNGLSGVALFYNYLYEVFEEEDFQNKLLSIIEKTNTLLTEEISISTLCSGLAGYGLVLLRINNPDIDIDEDYFENIDSLLLEDFEEMSFKNDYDFLHGSMGIAMYFIERYKTTKSETHAIILNNFSKVLISKINTNFKEVLIEHTIERDDYYSFGLAHGVPGYINFLIYLQKNFEGLEVNIDDSLRICIIFLKSYENYDTKSKQHYPNVVLLKKNEVISSRLSWCQGDLGVSNSLCNAGIYLNDEALIGEGLELMNKTRTISCDESGAKDIGICHGSAGILIQYYLAANKFNIDFSQNIDKWMDRIVQQTNNFSEFLDYSNYTATYSKEINFLSGAAGLGLVILTKENKIDTNWLEILNLH